MGIFSKKDKSYIGLDLGGNVIKLVELKNQKGRPHIVTYGYAQRMATSITNDFLDKPDELASIISDLCKQSRITTQDVVTALPAPAVFSTIVNLPTIGKNDIENKKKVEIAVLAEAKKVVPLPLEEMIIDWKILPVTREKQSEKDFQYQVLLTGASKKLVKKYMNIFKKAGLNLISLETESFALTRALIGNDKSVVMIVDVGALNTYLLVADGGVPFLDRTIGTAGFGITEAIADNMGLTLDQAEGFKFDTSMVAGNNNSQLSPIISNVIAPIIHEIKYTYNLYEQDEYGGKEIEKIILTGGTAQLPGLKEHLSQLLDTRVYIGDPWARIVYPEDLRPILNEIGSQFSIAIGLAMRDF
jgi:type IV pilus assembly protein PilM